MEIGRRAEESYIELLRTKSITKGQLISKCLFGFLNSRKKQTKKFDFTTTVPQVDLFTRCGHVVRDFESEAKTRCDF